MVISALVVLAACFFTVPAHAYFDRGTVSLTLGKTAVTLKEGETAKISVSFSPSSSKQTEGCGMAECPQICGEKGCLDENGNCTCAGTELTTYYASATVGTGNASVAFASYHDGMVSIQGVGEGTTTIELTAEMRQYTSSSQTIRVTVEKAAERKNANPSSGSASGKEQESVSGKQNSAANKVSGNSSGSSAKKSSEKNAANHSKKNSAKKSAKSSEKTAGTGKDVAGSKGALADSSDSAKKAKDAADASRAENDGVKAAEIGKADEQSQNVETRVVGEDAGDAPSASSDAEDGNAAAKLAGLEPDDNETVHSESETAATLTETNETAAEDDFGEAASSSKGLSGGAVAVIVIVIAAAAAVAISLIVRAGKAKQNDD